MRLEIQLDAEQYNAIATAAKQTGVPVAAWVRMVALEKARQLAPEPAKPPQARGPRKQTVDEYLESWDHREPFDNGQRRYGFVDRRFARKRDGSADDPGLHAAFEQDLRATYPKDHIDEAPELDAYWRDNYWVRPTDPLPRPSHDIASVDDNGRKRPTTLPEE